MSPIAGSQRAKSRQDEAGLWGLAALSACTAIAGVVAGRRPRSRSYAAAVAWGLAGVAAMRRHPSLVRGAAALAAATVVATATRRGDQ